MVNFISGPAGGHSLSRMQGTKVTLAGRTAFLPNDNVPFVVQRLTMGQINAIPKDRFAVSLIETPIAMAAPGRGGGGRSSGLKFQIKRQVRPAKRDGVIRFVRKPSAAIAAEIDGTKQYTAMISLIEQMKQNADSFLDTTLVLSRNQRTDPPEPDSGLFYAPIDDGSMSDCIKKAIAHFFGVKDTCKICGKEYKAAVFCLLMHCYFLRMHIMKNTTRTPFCEYLQKYVLKDEMMFSSRTFTGIASDYDDMIKDYTDPSKLKIDFDYHPKPSGKPLLDAFHEIGNYFHTSKYFKHLREMRDNMKGFMI